MDPASSSDDDSSSEVSEVKNDAPQLPQSFDDLPTDDSGSEISSDSDDSDDSDDNESNDDSDDDGSLDYDILENQTMEERLKIRQNYDIRRKKKTINDNKSEKSQIINQIKPKKGTHKNPKSTSSKKHAPKEVSSKRADYFRRGAPLQANSGIAAESTGAMNLYKSRDPRMGGLHGHFDQGAFDHNYAFLEEMQQKEMKQLKARIEARKMTGRKGQRKRKKLGLFASDDALREDEMELKRLLQLQSDKHRSRKEKATKSAIKRKMKEEIKSGKRTKEYYYKKKDFKRMKLEAQYDELKKKGGDAAIEKVLEKRRRKNLGKDGRFMPPKGI